MSSQSVSIESIKVQITEGRIVWVPKVQPGQDRGPQTDAGDALLYCYLAPEWQQPMTNTKDTGGE